ncbi:MAG: FIST C-terminal domain-containing protein [Actinomycetota bacterium]|nr:FIST C-terminal domain-containing protein [Actinomycetota bacterium]
MTRIGAGLSTADGAARAAREAADEAARALGGGEVDLAFLFLSPAHAHEAAAGAARVQSELAPRHLLGCVAEGVVGRGRELEEGPAAAVWAASLPGADVQPFHAAAVETDEGTAVEGLPVLAGKNLAALLVDPFTFPVAPVLATLSDEYPGVPLVGGIAVGGKEAGSASLILDDDVHDAGAVGVAFGSVEVRPLVSPGCAPIGRDAVITSAEENLVYELAGQPALERLREEIAALPQTEQALAARGLLAGLVIDENRPRYERGDYLMRGLLGADEQSGALAIGEQVRVGQTLRFHVRDARSADEDLRSALASLAGERAAGALLFTCNGRGTNMFAEPDHDARLVTEALRSDAVAGFFCGGEIGPVGGRALLHGFTATMAVFLDS